MIPTTTTHLLRAVFRGILNSKMKELKDNANKLALKRETQATYSQGIFALMRKAQSSGLLPEGTAMPSQNLDGVVRCLDMVRVL
jgi:hypothetical protein